MHGGGIKRDIAASIAKLTNGNVSQRQGQGQCEHVVPWVGGQECQGLLCGWKT